MSDTPGDQRPSRDEMLKAVEVLPSLPNVVAEMLALDPLDAGFILKVRELAELDPALASRVLGLANSAAFAGITDISDIGQAVIRLGGNRASELISSFADPRIFVPTTDGQRALWRHSIIVATMAKHIATHVDLGLSPGVLYTAGLLHDIGRLVMFAHDPKNLSETDMSLIESPDELVELEREVCGHDHTEVGAVVCDAWKIPATIATVIANHHRAELDDLSTQDAQSTLIVRQADISALILQSHGVTEEGLGDEALDLLLGTSIDSPVLRYEPSESTLREMVLSSLRAAQHQADVLGL